LERPRQAYIALLEGIIKETILGVGGNPSLNKILLSRKINPTHMQETIKIKPAFIRI